MDLTFVSCTEEFEAVARPLWPDAKFKRAAYPATGQAVYVAHAPEHLDMYERWFPGVTVRVHARLRHQPLHERGGMYLPVTYDSWLVVIDGPGAFGAAMEAAGLLHPVRTVVCPAFDAEHAETARESVAVAYGRWQDRVFPKA